MCLIAFALQPGTPLPLVIAGNRDEFWDRPTEALSPWQLPSGHTVWAGRDTRAGGSWLGFGPGGRVAMLTNVRTGLPDAAPRSRGLLVTDWLASTLPAETWLTTHAPQDYGPCNLVLGDWAQSQWFWSTNRPAPGGASQLPSGWYGAALGPGVYGLSNAQLDTPWPKTVRLKQALTGWLRSQSAAHTPVLQALSDLQLAPAAALPQTGVPAELEARLSSPFVYDPARRYGTRSSLLAHVDGLAGTQSLHLQEWTHAVQQPLPGGSARWPMEETAYSAVRRFSIPMWAMPASSKGSEQTV